MAQAPVHECPGIVRAHARNDNAPVGDEGHPFFAFAFAFGAGFVGQHIDADILTGSRA